jgi:hypothetical protein
VISASGVKAPPPVTTLMVNDEVVLICPPGAQDGEISHGDRCWEPWKEDIENPHSRWRVRVPREVAYHFCRVGGFVPLDPNLHLQ